MSSTVLCACMAAILASSHNRYFLCSSADMDTGNGGIGAVTGVAWLVVADVAIATAAGVAGDAAIPEGCCAVVLVLGADLVGCSGWWVFPVEAILSGVVESGVWLVTFLLPAVVFFRLFSMMSEDVSGTVPTERRAYCSSVSSDDLQAQRSRPQTSTKLLEGFRPSHTDRSPANCEGVAGAE